MGSKCSNRRVTAGYKKQEKVEKKQQTKKKPYQGAIHILYPVLNHLATSYYLG